MKVLVLLLALVLPAISCSGPERPLIKEVESAVMCPCPDNCGKVLINCICGYSPEYRAEIQAMIDDGKDLEEIVAAWVEKRGRIGLSAPTREGFDLLAWTMPFVVLLLAVPLVMVVIRRLGRSPGGAASGDTESSTAGDTTPENPDLDEQLDRELDELDP